MEHSAGMNEALGSVSSTSVTKLTLRVDSNNNKIKPKLQRIPSTTCLNIHPMSGSVHTCTGAVH